MKAEGALTPENRHNEVDSFGHTLGVRGPHDLLSTCVSEAHLYMRALIRACYFIRVSYLVKLWGQSVQN